MHVYDSNHLKDLDQAVNIKDFKKNRRVCFHLKAFILNFCPTGKFKSCDMTYRR